MAQVKISELDAVTTLTDNDVLPIVNSNDTKKVSISQLKTKITEGMSSLSFLVVQSLPTENISTSIIYLVPKTTSQTNNVYDEYIYVSNSWELIGTTQIDLSDYYTKTQTDAITGNLSNLTTTLKTNLVSAINEVDGAANPVITTDNGSTYTIASLTGNNVYKLGELTSLTITATTTFDKETIIYFSSGSTATSVSLPSSVTNLGDAPTMTEASSVNSGTCEASKSYIISVLNNIAIWKAY